MKAEILAVGTELLMGQIVNTNAQYISEKLNSIGVNVYYHSVVGDNRARLKDALDHAFSHADLVIMTGGLGPTQDDLTKETVAEYFGRRLVLDQESLEKIENYFKSIHKPMVKSNEKQAYIPEASIIIPNRNGTAPGCILDDGLKLAVMLPGPPKEMKPMLEEHVLPYLMQKSGQIMRSKYIRVFGIGESAVEDQLMDLVDGQTNPTIATYAKESIVQIRVTASCPPGEDAKAILDPVVSEIQTRLGNHIVSMNNEELEAVVASLLQEKKKTLATAESCTGGLLAGRITNVPGISSIFLRGFITYSNEAKIEHLGVKAETLARVGAVSEETAIEMAQGVKNISGADLGVSVTGIAGPGGASLNKPVGLVYVALAHQGGVLCKKLNLYGDRQRIRNSTCLHALDLIRLHLLQ